MINSELLAFPEETSDVQQQLSSQLAAIIQQLTKLNNTQEAQDKQLTFLSEKINQNNMNPPIVPEPTSLVQQQMGDIFKIPDPIKSIPNFDGNRRQLTAWLQTAENTLSVFHPLVTPQQFQLYVQAVSNKIQGKAKDILCLAGNPMNFVEIKDILMEALGDRQELSYYKSQLWATKQTENISVHNYFNKIKEITQNIKTLSKQNPKYNQAWAAINAFIEEDSLAAFLSGLRKPYFGYAQAAKPKSLEEAYAFLCKFNSNENISNSRKLTNPQHTYQTNEKKQFSVEQTNRNRNQNSLTNLKSYQNVKSNSSVQPMDIDYSLMSRKTLNGRVINNHELGTEEQQNPDNNEDEIQGEEINFHGDQESDTET